MSGHTPGPWRVELDDRGYVANIGTRGLDNKPGAVGSRLFRRDAFMTPSSPEALANARLIAAAPDLLATLERILDWCFCDDGRGVPECSRCVEVRAVIERAS